MQKLKLNLFFSVSYIIIGGLILSSIYFEFNFKNLANIIGVIASILIILAKYNFQIQQDKSTTRITDFLFLAPIIWFSIQNEILWGPLILVSIDLVFMLTKKWGNLNK